MIAAQIRDVEAQQLSAIQSIRETYSMEDSLDADGEPTHAAYHRDTALLLYKNHLPHFSRKELTRWAEILEEVTPLYGAFAHVNAKQRIRHARRRYVRFCELWPLLALQIFTDRISPPVVKKKKRLAEELLARIEARE